MSVKTLTVSKDLCRCCHDEGSFDDLAVSYSKDGSNKAYSDMIKESFNIELKPMRGIFSVVTYKICKTCIQKVQDCFVFKKQVQNCEAVFLELYKKTAGQNKVSGVAKNTSNTVDLCPASVDTRDDSSSMEDCGEFMKMEVRVDDVNATLKGTKIIERRRSPATKRKALKAKTKKAKNETDGDGEQQPSKKKKVATPKSKSKSKSKQQQQEMDDEMMAFKNTVEIAKNSYVCPFHTRTSLYYCFYCKDQYTNPVELREHTLEHDPVTLFENKAERKIPKIDITRIDCRLCSTEIDDLDTFKCHITSVHGVSLYPVKDEFLKFKLTFENLTCLECSKTFPYFDLLKKHMIEHFGKLVCDMCGACFLERNSLRTHIRSHKKVETNFPCNICGKNLKSKYSKDLHIATVHEKRPTVICYKCDATFLSHALRNKHLIEVHGDQRTFPCKLCDKVYNRRKTLMEHNRRQHQKVLRHQCELCDQRFYLPSQLKEHMSTHTGERNYKCELCDKSFPGRQSLRDHVRIHSMSEKKYKCHLCTSAFSQHTNWKNHLKNHHVGYGSTVSNVT